MTHRILFVCLGNICRSPAAEGVVRDMARARGLDVHLDSAGTGDWHVGAAPYGPMVSAASLRGYDLSRIKARQVREIDFLSYALIIGMDRENISNLRALQPKHGSAQLAEFVHYAPSVGVTHVADPYYTRDFEAALDVIEMCAKGLLDQISKGELAPPT